MTMRRLLWIWALISVGWAILIIAPNWSTSPEPPPLRWGDEHRECRDRLAFWPDGTRMGDDEFEPYTDMILDLRLDYSKRQLSDREQWARDIREKVASCEYTEWRPIGIQQIRLALLGAAFVPPAILFLLGAAIAFGWKHYGETIIRDAAKVPRHIRRGFIRLYIVVAVPWIAWFGYKAYGHFQSGDEDEGWGAILALLVVPVGALILYFVVLWIAAGFRKRAEDKADQT
jgi:hypothetical protein